MWKVRRSGDVTHAERPEIETFGENVGLLTHEVFRLEVTDSGFYRMLSEATAAADDYETALARFNGELGGEARAILRSMIRDADV